METPSLDSLIFALAIKPRLMQEMGMGYSSKTRVPCYQNILGPPITSNAILPDAIMCRFSLSK